MKYLFDCLYCASTKINLNIIEYCGLPRTNILFLHKIVYWRFKAQKMNNLSMNSI